MATQTLNIEKDDFVILKYKARFVITHLGFVTEYAIAKPDKDGEVIPVQITKEKALRLIEEHGLVKVHHDENGTVYDKPGQDFRRKFENKRLKIREVVEPKLEYNRN